MQEGLHLFQSPVVALSVPQLVLQGQVVQLLQRLQALELQLGLLQPPEQFMTPQTPPTTNKTIIQICYLQTAKTIDIEMN